MAEVFVPQPLSPQLRPLSTESVLNGLTKKDMMGYFEKWKESLNVAEGEGVVEASQIKASMDKKVRRVESNGYILRLDRPLTPLAVLLPF
jgi:hypothetical protein